MDFEKFLNLFKSAESVENGVLILEQIYKFTHVKDLNDSGITLQDIFLLFEKDLIDGEMEAENNFNEIADEVMSVKRIRKRRIL